MARLVYISALLTLTVASIVGALPSNRNSGNSRVVNGSPAALGDFPSMLSTFYHENGMDYHNCGAILIGEKTALTAAHCMTRSPGTPPPTDVPNDMSLRAGSIADDHGGVVSKISKIIIHPQYTREGVKNDIAILHLEKPIPEGPNIRYAALPKKYSDPAPNSRVLSAGWGRTMYNGNVSSHLLYMNVPVIDRKICQGMHALLPGWGIELSETIICAGADLVSSCHGDSGGPLYDETRETVIGVVSAGYQCGQKGHPTIFTRVSKYIHWIEKNTA
ncbi:hypothetical protein LOZ58_001782 [Ophidiomyces ophidiicola]|nr:hypothetical protein LOZ58_001782 [Ophidiomyces ophidiicola]